jgi:hypothetical protein
MPAHRRLLTVIRNMRRRQTAGNKIRRVLVDDLRPFIETILPLFAPRWKRERNVERWRRANK